MDRAKSLEEGIKSLIETIDHEVESIDLDFRENQDGIRYSAGGTYLKGQLKVYNQMRDYLESILEDEE